MTLFKLFWLIGHLLGEDSVELFCDFKVTVGVEMTVSAKRRFDVFMPQTFLDLEWVFTEADQQRHMRVTEAMHSNSLNLGRITVRVYNMRKLALRARNPITRFSNGFIYATALSDYLLESLSLRPKK